MFPQGLYCIFGNLPKGQPNDFAVMIKSILVVEDEHNVAAFIKQGLNEAGYEVLLAYDGQMGLELLSQKAVDLVILDVILPVMDGLEVLSRIRAMGNGHLPVIMLTALGTTENVVRGLDQGADDYLVKPFKFKELLARIRVLTRRGSLQVASTPLLVAADLELDMDAKLVRRAGTEIKLTSTEYRLLEFLLKNKNRVLSRVDILEHVWDINFNMGTNVVDVYVNYLRNKVDRNFRPKLIQTVIGMGYTLKDQ